MAGSIKRFFGRRTPRVLWAGLCTFMVLGAGCSKQSAEDIARDLSGKLSDNMDFTNGTRVKGPAPTVTQGAPLVTNFDAADTLYTGKPFEVTLYSDYPDFKNIQGSILYVGKQVFEADAGAGIVWANQYISVDTTAQAAADTGSIKLVGKLGGETRLAGERFVVRLGLFDAKGVGNYMDWQVAVDTGECADGTVCEKFCSRSLSCGSSENPDTCMPNCQAQAVKYLETFQTRMSVCLSIENCDSAYQCLLDSFDLCPQGYGAKNGYCVKRNACDPTVTIDQCHTVEDVKAKWQDSNCMCPRAVSDYLQCIQAVGCAEFNANLDGSCASLIPSSPRNVAK